MDPIINSFGNLGNIDLATIFKFNDLTRDIQKHLARVYTALILCLFSACLGVIFNIYTGFGGMLGVFGAIGMLYWLQVDRQKTAWMRRMCILCGFGFLKGTSLGHIIRMVAWYDPSIIVTALLGTIAVFSCFSMAALVAKRRSYLFLGGILSSATTLLLVLGLANMFMGSIKVYMFQLYVGLMAFSGFVIFDTQMIIEKAHHGSRDFAGHASELFVDFVAIFIRLLLILMRQAEKKDDRRKKRY
mmetsp:Transcript_26169/g.26409  ORF Transcript_26169/g.26409 Transcript_26169/m.26409 type:complete len:244 (+) Transcript_26169:152-883(+)